MTVAPDIHTLVQRGDLDAVVVCAAAPDRADVIRAAADAGLHVLADKPLALSAQQVQRIAVAARTSGTVVAVAQHLRHHPMVAPLVAGLRGGRVGLPWSVQVDFVVAGGTSAGVHELANLGIYPIDLLQVLLGQTPQSVHASRAHRGDGEAFVLSIDYTNGVTATIVVCRTPRLAGYAPSQVVLHRYRVAGTIGTLSADLTLPTVTVLGPEGPRRNWIGRTSTEACVDDFLKSVTCGRAPACARASSDDLPQTPQLEVV